MQFLRIHYSYIRFCLLNLIRSSSRSICLIIWFYWASFELLVLSQLRTTNYWSALGKFWGWTHHVKNVWRKNTNSSHLNHQLVSTSRMNQHKICDFGRFMLTVLLIHFTLENSLRSDSVFRMNILFLHQRLFSLVIISLFIRMYIRMVTFVCRSWVTTGLLRFLCRLFVSLFYPCFLHAKRKNDHRTMLSMCVLVVKAQIIPGGGFTMIQCDKYLSNSENTELISSWTFP